MSTKHYWVILAFALLLILALFSNLQVINDKTINVQGTTVIVSSQVIFDLHKMWQNTSENEYMVCLRGTANQSTVTVKSYDSFTIGNQYSVQPKTKCGSLAMLHKHPTVGCMTRLDQQDYYSMLADLQSGAFAYIIQCEQDKFQVYTQQNPVVGQIVTI